MQTLQMGESQDRINPELSRALTRNAFGRAFCKATADKQAKQLFACIRGLVLGVHGARTADSVEKWLFYLYGEITCLLSSSDISICDWEQIDESFRSTLSVVLELRRKLLSKALIWDEEREAYFDRIVLGFATTHALLNAATQPHLKAKYLGWMDELFKIVGSESLWAEAMVKPSLGIHIDTLLRFLL